jgi:hypothetical protein
MFPLNTIIPWSINIIMNKKYDNNNIIIASRAYFLHLCGFYVCEFIWETCRERGWIEQLDVRKQYSQFYLITFIYVEFLHSYIYIYWSPSLHLDRTEAGSSSSNRACTSNLRGSGGILTWWGHSTNRRISSALRVWKIVTKIILYICMNV